MGDGTFDAMVIAASLVGFYTAAGVAIGLLVSKVSDSPNLAIVTGALWPVMSVVLCFYTVVLALRPRRVVLPRAKARRKHLKIIK